MAATSQFDAFVALYTVYSEGKSALLEEQKEYERLGNNRSNSMVPGSIEYVQAQRTIRVYEVHRKQNDACVKNLCAQFSALSMHDKLRFIVQSRLSDARLYALYTQEIWFIFEVVRIITENIINERALYSRYEFLSKIDRERELFDHDMLKVVLDAYFYRFRCKFGAYCNRMGTCRFSHAKSPCWFYNTQHCVSYFSSCADHVHEAYVTRFSKVPTQSDPLKFMLTAEELLSVQFRQYEEFSVYPLDTCPVARWIELAHAISKTPHYIAYHGMKLK
jgi:hypothetical protein